MFRCGLHNSKMWPGIAHITYGRPVGEYLDARECEFPNSRLRVLGGCLVKPISPKHRLVLFCPTCRKAETEWRIKKDWNNIKPRHLQDYLANLKTKH